jgi:hypothetical protein
MHKASKHEIQFQTSKGKYQVAQMLDYSSDSDSDDENEVVLAEWNKNLKVVNCSWVKRETSGKRYEFLKIMDK